MKHIYIINNGSRAAKYGIGTHIGEIVKCLKVYVPFLQITIIVFDSYENEVKMVYKDKIRFLLLPNILAEKKTVDYERYYRSVLYTLINYINNKEDLIFHFHYVDQGWLIRGLKKIYPCSHIILTIHYMSWCFSLNGNLKYFTSIISKKNKERNYIESLIFGEYQNEKKLYEDVDTIVCLCQDSEKVLTSIYNIPKCKIKLIYNGLENKENKFDINIRNSIKRKLSFKKNEIIIIYVGRLDDKKGIAYLIEAFRKLITTVKNVHLVIVGSGNFNLFLNQSKDIGHKITFTGLLNRDDLFEFYQIADIGVLPSLHEQCSYVAIEMMMFSIPWIGTDGFGIREMILDNYFVPVNFEDDKIVFSIEKLYSLLLQLCNEQQEMRIKSLEKYQSKYSMQEMKKNILDLYEINLFNSIS